MIDSLAGTITTINLQVFITPEQCIIYESCVRDVLCKATQCFYENNSIFINWIW